MGGAEEDTQDYFIECRELVKTLRLEKVFFTGNINVLDYLGKMDIIILTSISEGQPISILEAMSAGKPCIATRVGCCQELLYGSSPDDLPCGIITPIMSVAHISNAIVELATDPEKRRIFGERGRERVIKQYRKENLISVYKNLYAELYNDYILKNKTEVVKKWPGLGSN